MQMARIVAWIGVSCILLSVAARVSAQGTRTTAQNQSPSGLIVSAEAFCSTTKIRTSSVRLRWSLSSQERTKNQLPRLAGATQRIETTVFLNGFEKGLFVTLPVPPASTPAAKFPAVQATTEAPQMRQALPRSFQIRLVEARPATDREIPGGDDEFTAVVEDLEPGLNYKWRLTIDGPAGAVVSVPVELQAVTCPVDEAEEPKTPPLKKPPPPKPPGEVRR
jgi:hypothetical protein